MTPGMPIMPGMAGYGARGRMPMLKYDAATGRKYMPYHRRPLVLDRRVWTWLAALPFICIVLFSLGYNFPSCDAGDDDGPGGALLQEGGEDILSPHHRGRSQSNFRSHNMSLMNPTSDYTSSTIHTMTTQSKPPSQIRYRGPSKSNMFQAMQRGREDESIERERAFDPKREPTLLSHIPESDVDIQEFVPPVRGRQSRAM